MSLDSMRCQLRLKENKNLKNSKTGFKENRIHLTHAYTTHTHTHKERKEENGSAIYGLAAAADERVHKKIGKGTKGKRGTTLQSAKALKENEAAMRN